MAPQPQVEEKPSNAKVIGVVSFYIVAAIMMVTVNKWVLISSPIPIFFLFCQLAIAVVLLLLCQSLRFLSLPAWNTTTALRLWPLIAVNVMGLIFNNLCLQYVDASFYQIARGLVLPITVGLSFVLQSSPPSARATYCCVGITAGFGVGVLYDNHATGKLHTSFVGVAFGILSSCTTAFHSIVIKKTLPIVNGSTIDLAWYTNLLSTVVIVPIIFVMGEVPAVMHVLGGGEGAGRFFWGSVVTGVVGFLICIAGFLSIKVTSPVTHMVSSAARGVIQTLLSIWVFGDIISGARATSIFLITLASMAYVWVKHVENNAPSASTSSGSSSTLFDKDRDMPLDRRDGGDEEKEDQVPLLNKGSEQV